MRAAGIRFAAKLAIVAVLGLPAVIVGGSATTAAAVNETLTVHSYDAGGTTSASTLAAGTTYFFTIRGLYTYNLRFAGQPGGQADAACSNAPPDPTFQRNRFAVLEPGGQLFATYVNNQPVNWQATTPDAFTCNSSDHTYTLAFSPTTAGPVNFRVHDFSNAGNIGDLTVTISQAAETLLDTVNVPTNTPAGALSTASLDPSKSYRLEARGLYTFGLGPAQADASCSGVSPAPFLPIPWAPVVNPLDPTARPLSLYVNNQAVNWAAKTPSPAGCASDNDHTYTLAFRPPSAGPVGFRILDNNYGDNVGTLVVRIFEVVSAAPAVGQIGVPAIALADQLSVDSANPNGASDAVPLVAGQSYVVEASGVYAYGVGLADAECSTTTLDPNFVSARYGPDVLTLLAGASAPPDPSLDRGVDWRPVESTAPVCSPSHTYRTLLVPASSGIVNFRVLDTVYADNVGTLTVKIFRIREVPLAPVTVLSFLSQPTPGVPLLGGHTYRVNATGTYGYASSLPGADADANCSTAGFPPYNDLTYKANRFGGGYLSLLMNEAVLPWAPQDGSASGCDANHVYNFVLSPSTTVSSSFRIYDQPTAYGDNTGFLTAQAFLEV